MVLVLKTELNGDLRRIPLHNDFLTFDELHLMLCRVYSCDIGMVCQYNLSDKVECVLRMALLMKIGLNDHCKTRTSLHCLNCQNK